MKNSIKTSGLVLAILFACTTVISAQNGMGRGYMRAQNGMGRGYMWAQNDTVRAGMMTQNYRRIPDLTEKQKTDLTALAEKQRTEMQALRSEMQATTDIQKRGDIAKKIQILRDTHRQNVLNLLTDKQKEAFLANRGTMPGMGGRGPMNGNFRGRGPSRGMGYGNMNCGCYGRGPRGRMGYGNMNRRW